MASGEWSGEKELDESLRAFGFFQEEDSEELTFSLYEENTNAVEFFLTAQTQWKFTALGKLAGFDYAGINALMDMLGLEDKKQMLMDLQVMERTYKTEVNDG